MQSGRVSVRTRLWPLLVVVSLSTLILAQAPIAHAKEGSKKRYGRQIGKDSKKILVRDGKTLLWAGGDLENPEKSLWYDFTNAAIPAEQLQFGIGKDRIKAIDDPLFVSPDDQQLSRCSKNWSTRSKKLLLKNTDDLLVMGYVINGEARAYPSALLNRHELVNDRFGSKPVTVGW